MDDSDNIGILGYGSHVSPDICRVQEVNMDSYNLLGLIWAEHHPKNLCVARELITPYPNIVRIIYLELGPWRHLK